GITRIHGAFAEFVNELQGVFVCLIDAADEGAVRARQAVVEKHPVRALEAFGLPESELFVRQGEVDSAVENEPAHIRSEQVRVGRAEFSSVGEPEVIKKVDIQCRDRKSTRLNSSHVSTSYAVFCLKKKKHH